MLLCLYVALNEGAELTQRILCAMSAEPFAPAHCRLRKMEEKGLVTLRDGSQEGGETVIVITDEAAAAVELLLHDLASSVHCAQHSC
jgi:hypothetical protein